jgi:NifU-like protein involved in Fe-S cluster formation
MTKVMDFDRYKEINDQRWNYREMEDATVVSYYRNTGCGDGYRIYLKIAESGLVEDASYTTTGCGFGIVALAIACEIAKGKTLEEIKALTVEDLETMFEFPERRKNYPQSALQALHKAVRDHETGQGVPPEKRITKAFALNHLKETGNLSGVNLSSVILEKEDMTGVDFSGSNLHNAFLQAGNFSNANFSGANLRGAFFNGSNLSGANFSGADLRWAKLTGVNLEGANFRDAIYDIGTRVDPKNLWIFDQMKKEGKDIYLKAEET